MCRGLGAGDSGASGLARRVNKVFRIETERLTIRPWLREDEGVFRSYTRNARMMRYVSGPELWPEDRVQEFLARQRTYYAELGFGLGALEERGTETVIGLGGLQPLGTTADLALAWCVAESRTGRGYATEAGRASAAFAFDVLAVRRVKAIADPTNGASIRVMEKLGMESEGVHQRRDLGLRFPDESVVLYSLERSRAHATGG